MEEVKTLRIAVIVDIGEDTIVTSEPLQNIHPDAVLECWSPNGVMTLFTVRAYNGCIVEYKDAITKTGRLPPVGSLLVNSTDNIDNAWFVNRLNDATPRTVWNLIKNNRRTKTDFFEIH